MSKNTGPAAPPFTVAQWRTYLSAHIKKLDDAGEPEQRIKRYQRLLCDRKLDRIWLRLAKHVRLFPPGHFGPGSDWDEREALLQVAGTIASPSSMLASPPTKEQLQPVLNLLVKLKHQWARAPSVGGWIGDCIPPVGEAWRMIRLPTTVGETQLLIETIKSYDWAQHRPWLNQLANTRGKNGLRNWLAFYLRERVVPCWFTGRHDAAIAELIHAADPENFHAFADGARSVRALRPLGKLRPTK